MMKADPMPLRLNMTSVPVLASIPAIILLVAAQKYIAAGTTGGAVK